ncbi:MAG TPA: NADH-quinone oxidoreductase subunit M [Acidimicrobiales bacterium]|jgi:NADH-quinone oxidoreductase subunit M|nr:NADH-quinone oxidoreductase subunit M [Acidimicrobiales bacterium]
MRHEVPFLTLLILIPAIAAAVLGLLGLDRRLHREVTYALALLASLATLGFAIAVLVVMKVQDGGFQLVSDHDYTGTSLGVHWYLGVDGISIFLVLLTAVLFPLAIILGRNRENSRVYFAWMLLLEAAVMGSFLSLDLIVFFFMFELTLVPSYFIIAGWGHQRRAYAAIKFFLYTFLGSAFLLVGILALAFIHQAQYGYLTFSLGPLMQTHLTGTQGVLLFLAFTAAFAVKAPLFPLHTWSPDAYTEAPEEGSVVLSGVLAKIGTYGIIRFDLSLFPQATRTLAPILLTLAVIGIVYGAIVACAQRDLKRLVTYSSLAQIGFIALGTIALSTQGLAGGVLLMLNHGLIVGALFILIGFLYQRRGSWQAGEMRGLQKAAPVLAAVFTVVMMASIGVPGLNGFVSEFLVLSGTFITHRWWAVVAVLGVIVAAIYLLWAYQQVFHGKPREADEKTRDLALLERAVMAPLIILIVFLGIYPKPVLDRINPSVNQLIAHVESTTGHAQPPVAVKGVEGIK